MPTSTQVAWIAFIALTIFGLLTARRLGRKAKVAVPVEKSEAHYIRIGDQIFSTLQKAITREVWPSLYIQRETLGDVYYISIIRSLSFVGEVKGGQHVLEVRLASQGSFPITATFYFSDGSRKSRTMNDSSSSIELFLADAVDHVEKVKAPILASK